MSAVMLPDGSKHKVPQAVHMKLDAVSYGHVIAETEVRAMLVDCKTHLAYFTVQNVLWDVAGHIDCIRLHLPEAWRVVAPDDMITELPVGQVVERLQLPRRLIGLRYQMAHA